MHEHKQVCRIIGEYRPTIATLGTLRSFSSRTFPLLSISFTWKSEKRDLSIPVKPGASGLVNSVMPTWVSSSVDFCCGALLSNEKRRLTTILFMGFNLYLLRWPPPLFWGRSFFWPRQLLLLYGPEWLFLRPLPRSLPILVQNSRLKICRQMKSTFCTTYDVPIHNKLFRFIRVAACAIYSGNRFLKWLLA